MAVSCPKILGKILHRLNTVNKLGYVSTASLNLKFFVLKHMRVRTLTGSTYYMRSGARITGNVHERFMLIDGNRVATGSYR